MRILWLAILIVLIGGGVLIYSNRSQNNTTSSNTKTDQTETSTENLTTTETPSEASQTKAAGAYVDYSNSVITSTVGTKILFFHAPWCPQCRALESSIKSSQIPDGLTIIKVDYDNNQQLRQKYGVTIQTTLVKVDDDGNLVKKYVAYDEPTFVAMKTNLL